MHRRLSALLLVTVLISPTLAVAQSPVVGDWSGTLSIQGSELRVVFHVTNEADSLTGTMDSPDQGATGIPVSDVTVAGDSLTISVARIGGVYEGVLSDDGSTIEGSWTQGGRSFPLTLTPATEADTAPPPRPQHPEPPYPYETTTVTFQNPRANLALAGTLTKPRGDGPYPGVVLVSGSGPQNRDSEVFNHKIFHVLADHLTREGMAVLRYDERGVGKSGGKFEGATSEDFASDVAAAARFLASRPAVDSSAVGILGMSEGGIVAPMVHTEFQDVAFLVLMAGPSVPGHDLLVEQQARLLAAQESSEEAVDSLRSQQRRILNAVRSGADSAAIAETIRPLLQKEGASDKQVTAQIEQITSPWFRFFVQYDPGPALRELDVPVLALFGSKDLQVPPEQNAEPMRTALEASPSSDDSVRVLEGLNHLFQPADTGLPSEYAKIDTTMAPTALEAVSDWIRTRTSTTP